MFNIDSIWANIQPFIRYPLLPLIVIESGEPFRLFGFDFQLIYPVLLAYSVLFKICQYIDSNYKTRGAWISIKDIANPTCVITGGSSGLGKEIVKELLQKVTGARVIILDILEPDPSLCDSSSTQVVFINCDLSSDDAVTKAIESIKSRYGKVHLFINNAAIRGRFSRLADMPGNEIGRIFQANVVSAIRLIQAFHPKGSDPSDVYYVVNIASALGIFSPARASTYAASKAALISYHESWTYELLSDNVMNIRTLLVLPGQMNTQMFGSVEPPRKFLAPVVDAADLSKNIVQCCIEGKRGEICKPFYVHFLRIMKCLPEIVIEHFRSFSKMDEVLPIGKSA